jgi:hypothetical protein
VLLVAFNVHVCVPVCDREYFIPCATMANVPGEKAAQQKAQPDCSQPPPLSDLAAAVTAAVAEVSRASFRFPSLVVGNDLNLGERRG